LLQARWSGDQIPLEARSSIPAQTAPGAHPTSYTMDTGSYLGVKRPGPGVSHPPPSSAEVKERVELSTVPPLCLHGWLQGELNLFITVLMIVQVAYMELNLGGGDWGC